MSEEDVAQELAAKLKQQDEREFVLAKDALLDPEAKKVAAPQMWKRLAAWLEKTVELTNECLGQPDAVSCQRYGYKITLSTRLGRTRTVAVEFNIDNGRISYGPVGKDPDRFEPVINGVGFAYRKGSTDMAQEEEMGREILNQLR